MGEHGFLTMSIILCQVGVPLLPPASSIDSSSGELVTHHSAKWLCASTTVSGVIPLRITPTSRMSGLFHPIPGPASFPRPTIVPRFHMTEGQFGSRSREVRHMSVTSEHQGAQPPRLSSFELMQPIWQLERNIEGLLEPRIAWEKARICRCVSAGLLEKRSASTFTNVALSSVQSWMSAVVWSNLVEPVAGQAWNGRYCTGTTSPRESQQPLSARCGARSGGVHVTMPQLSPRLCTWAATGCRPAGNLAGSVDSRPSAPRPAHGRLLPFGKV